MTTQVLHINQKRELRHRMDAIDIALERQMTGEYTPHQAADAISTYVQIMRVLLEDE